MKIKILFILIVLLAAFLRFNQLGSNPPSLDWDEASIGYNAYSILKTGHDEFNAAYPLAIRSLNDYKPPLLTYLAIPSIAIFGPNEFAVRFPSALLGIIAVISTYFLTTKLFDKKIGIIAMFVLAISPWHLQFSRVAFESNSALTLIILGTLFFLYGIKNRYYFALSMFLFGLSLYAYHSARVFAPIFLFVLLIIYWKEFIADKARFLIGGVILAICVAPLIWLFFQTPQAFVRASGVSVFNNVGQLEKREGPLLKIDKSLPGTPFKDQFENFVDRFMYSEKLRYPEAILEGYLSQWDFNWLFVKGDNQRHHAPSMGLLYLIELPFLLLGICLLVTYKNKKTKYIIFSWFLLAPVAASATIDVPHAVRSLLFLPVIQIIIALGIFATGSAILSNRNMLTSKLLLIVLVILYVGNMTYYFELYYNHLPNEYSEDWQYGYKDLVSWINNNQNKFNNVIISSTLDQPYIFYLFYAKYDPKSYLSKGGTEVLNKDRDMQIGNVIFKKVLEEDYQRKNTAIILAGSELQKPVLVQKQFKYLDGNIFAIETNSL